MATPQIVSSISFAVDFSHVAILDDGQRSLRNSLKRHYDAYHEDEAYAQKAWSTQRTFDTSGVEFDLTALDVLDDDGNTLDTINLSSGAGVNAFFLKNFSNDNEITLSQGALNGWDAGLFAAGANTDIRVGPGAILAWGGGAQSYAVSGSAKTFNVAASTNNAKAWVAVIGDDA